jgi:hypothetical protein
MVFICASNHQSGTGGRSRRRDLLMERIGWACRRFDQTGKVSAMTPEQEHGED